MSLKKKQNVSIPPSNKNKKTKRKTLEPHVIIHLRITEEDIAGYMNQKIQFEPTFTEYNEAPSAYDPMGSSLNNNFTNINDEENLYIKQEKIKHNEPLAYEANYDSLQSLQNESYVSRESTNYNLNVSSVCLEDHPNVPSAEPYEDENCSDVKFRVLDAMGEFADANRRKEWPRSTSVWCRWCCDSFTGPPVAIPRWKVKDTFFVYGCYCSYSCASAHLFFRGDITEDDKWESYHLLHLLRKKILGFDITKRIRLADPQEVLQKFGGHLSVEQFRDRCMDTHTHHGVYKILYPPMVSIVPKIEEQNFSSDDNMRLINTSRSYGKLKYVDPKDENYHSKQRYGHDQPYIPVDEERITKARENLKIQRSKPLLDKKHTLFNYMNLQVKEKI